MAIDLNRLEWALSSISQTVTLPDGSVITVNNKEEPTEQIKNSGLLYEQPLPRAYLNFLLNEIYLAIADLDSRIP